MNSADDRFSLLHFKVGLAGGAGSSGSLYNNGHHQCKVSVEVVKGARNDLGVWSAVELTAQERESITLVTCSNGTDEALPPGWSCDTQRNIFDLGLWEHTEKKELHEDVAETFIFDCKVERISRYLRMDPSADFKSVTLIAQIALGGEIYTTNFSRGGVVFESSVTIEPVRPYRLNVSDLTEYVDHSALLEGRAYGICYYWTPPVGLTFTYSGGLSRPIKFSEEGEFFNTSYVYSNSEGHGSKAGVVVGKDAVGLQLRLSDVHHGYHFPYYNPAFRFNEQPTIMRAILLHDKMPVRNEDSSSVWWMWDNHGNRHSFKLATDGAYRLKLMDVVDVPEEVNFKVFKIYVNDGGAETGNLYANGRHQCKVDIEVTKQVPDAWGNWRDTPLTEAERESLTVTSYSSNIQAQLPLGWSCDKEKNMFDTGLWRRGTGDQVLSVEDLSGVTDSGIEIISRYMRVAGNVPIESQRFMARVVVGGKIYTTYFFTGNSYVTILPTRPYSLRVGELRAYSDENALRDSWVDCDVYYWLPPSGLRFLINRGLDAPVRVSNEGDYFQTAWSMVYSGDSYRYRKAGVVLTNRAELGLRVKDVHRNVYAGGDGSNPYINFNNHNTIMRVVRMLAKESFGTGNTNTPWRLWDNYGCEHVYRIDHSADGSRVVLKDYQ